MADAARTAGRPDPAPPHVGVRLEDVAIERLTSLLRAAPRSPSEYSLPNLCLYRDRHRYHLVEDAAGARIVGRTYDDQRHAMPMGPLDTETVASWLEEVDCVYPLDEVEARRLADAGRFALKADPADADYIYRSDDLARLVGAKVKRAQARQFERAAAVRFVQFGHAGLPIARSILRGWFEDVGRTLDRTDLAECDEALSRMSELDLSGFLAFSGDEPAGFLLAGAPRGDERTIHFAKGRRHLSGVYPWMFSTYAGRCGVSWLNFEQDLGNPGLAQSKRAFAPAEIRAKFRLSRSRQR